MADDNTILKDLNRAKALAQAQALCAAMGLNPALVRYQTEDDLSSDPERQTDLTTKEDEK